jgi:hypothetical protein
MSAISIVAFKGTIGSMSISDKTNGKGDFKPFKAISNAGTKNIIMQHAACMPSLVWLVGWLDKTLPQMHACVQSR